MWACGVPAANVDEASEPIMLPVSADPVRPRRDRSGGEATPSTWPGRGGSSGWHSSRWTLRIIAVLPGASEYLRMLPNPFAGEWSHMGKFAIRLRH